MDYEGSEQSEVSPTGRYSGQTSDEEEVKEAEESMREYNPGAYATTRENILLGQFVKLAKKRAATGDDFVLVDQLQDRFKEMI